MAKVTVKKLVMLNGLLSNVYRDIKLKKIGWCFARNKVKINPIIEVFGEKARISEAEKRLDAALIKLAEDFAYRDPEGSVIYEPNPRPDGKRLPRLKDVEGYYRAAEVLRGLEDWKEAVEAEKAREELTQEILNSEEEIDFYTITESVFQQYNDNGNGGEVVAMLDQAFLFELGVIVSDPTDSGE